MNEEISHGERKDQAQTSKEKKPIEWIKKNIKKIDFANEEIEKVNQVEEENSKCDESPGKRKNQTEAWETLENEDIT